MSTSENKLLIRRLIKEIVNTGNGDRLYEFLAPDFVQIAEGALVVTCITMMGEHRDEWLPGAGQITSTIVKRQKQQGVETHV